VEEQKRKFTQGARLMVTRREFIGASGAAFALAGLGGAFARQAAAANGPALLPELPAGLRSVANLEVLPGKKPLIKLSYRPPN
jgi:hypothetical protein